jgi:hypothetical protein
VATGAAGVVTFSTLKKSFTDRSRGKEAASITERQALKGSP